MAKNILELPEPSATPPDPPPHTDPLAPVEAAVSEVAWEAKSIFERLAMGIGDIPERVGHIEAILREIYGRLVALETKK